MQTDVRDPEDKLILSRIYSAQGELTLTQYKPKIAVWKWILFAFRIRSHIIHIACAWRAHNLPIHQYHSMV